jgi:hypothetical protein
MAQDGRDVSDLQAAGQEGEPLEVVVARLERVERAYDEVVRRLRR